MSRGSAAAVSALFAVPFLLLAYTYASLPAAMPVTRATFAAKSLFTVFRVPVMNLSHGAMTAIMLSHTLDFDEPNQRAAYFALFSTLLIAIALKSNFEALELSGLGPWATFGSVASVVGGLALAFFRARRARIDWRQLRLVARDKFALVALFLFYLAIVAQSFAIGRRA